MADETENDAPEGEEQDVQASAEEESQSETPQDAAETEAQEEQPAVEEEAADAEVDAQPQAEAQPEGDGGDEPAQAPSGGGEPAQALSPKQRRRLERSRHEGEARPQRSPQERQSERRERRATKAVSRRARRATERAKAKERAKNRPPAQELAPVHAAVKGARRIRQGVVISDKASKTITVRIDVARRHRRYEKIVRSSSTLHAHDEKDDAREGDVVRVVESRPLSRTKRWMLLDVVERAR
jgi:small subunit ribosomal protein S17